MVRILGTERARHSPQTGSHSTRPAAGVGMFEHSRRIGSPGSSRSQTAATTSGVTSQLPLPLLPSVRLLAPAAAAPPAVPAAACWPPACRSAAAAWNTSGTLSTRAWYFNCCTAHLQVCRGEVFAAVQRSTLQTVRSRGRSRGAAGTAQRSLHLVSRPSITNRRHQLTNPRHQLTRHRPTNPGHQLTQSAAPRSWAPRRRCARLLPPAARSACRLN